MHIRRNIKLNKIIILMLTIILLIIPLVFYQLTTDEMYDNSLILIPPVENVSNDISPFEYQVVLGGTVGIGVAMRSIYRSSL